METDKHSSLDVITAPW